MTYSIKITDQQNDALETLGIEQVIQAIEDRLGKGTRTKIEVLGITLSSDQDAVLSRMAQKKGVAKITLLRRLIEEQIGASPQHIVPD